MSTPEQSFADALHDAHTSLLRDLQELEKAVSPTASEGAGELGSRLARCGRISPIISGSRRTVGTWLRS
jgi:hypothetical protein